MDGEEDCAFAHETVGHRDARAFISEISRRNLFQAPERDNRLARLGIHFDFPCLSPRPVVLLFNFEPDR